MKEKQIRFSNTLAKGGIGLRVLMMEEKKKFDRRERDLTHLKLLLLLAGGEKAHL